MANNLPAGMRNNNPGNIKFSPAIDWQGQVGPSLNTDQGDPQVVFQTPQAGMRALAKNVLYKYNHGYTTINQLIAGPGGWTPGYSPGAAGVASAAGLPADQPVDMNNPDILAHVVRGIVTQEQGPSSRLYSDQLIASGIGAAGVKHYDAAGNQVQPQPAQQPVPLAPLPGGNAPASAPAVSPDDDALLAKYLGGASPAQQPATGNAAPSGAAPSNPDDDALLAKYLGTPDTNVFGTTARPGTPEYAKAAVAAVQSGAPLPAADPTQHPEIPPPPADVVPGAVRAFSENAVNAVPVVGPMIHGARNMLMGAEGGAQMDALGQEASAANPLAAGAGTVFGTIAPLAAAGTTALGARLLGMSGGLPARIGMGALSGGVLSGADTLARGGSPQDAGQNALIGGSIGGALPIAGNLAGNAVRSFFGPSAGKMVGNALLADENSPSQVNQLLAAKGPGATIADLGPNSQSLAAGLASLPGEPKSIVVRNLQARAADTGNRLAADVAGTIGAGQPIGALTDSIVQAQKAAADPLYAAVREVPVQMTDDLKSVMDTPLGKRAFAKAAELAANDGKTATQTVTLSPQDIANKVLSGALSPAEGEKLIQSGGVTSTAPKLTVGLVDYAKQALDDIAGAAKRSGENNDARQASIMASRLTGATDAQVPAYAHARDAFAGPAKVLDAVEQGQGIFSNKMSPEDLQSAMANMSASEKDGLIAGAQAAVQKAIGSARTDAAGVKSLFDSAYGKQKLAILVGQPQADRIAAALERERSFSDTSGKAYRNSITSANAAQQKVISPELSGFQGKQTPQSWAALLFSGLEKARSAVTGKYRAAQNIAAANMLTQGALGPSQLGAVSGGARNALLAPAAAPLLAKQGNVPVGNMLTWAQPPANGPLHIVVRGANAAQ